MVLLTMGGLSLVGLGEVVGAAVPLEVPPCYLGAFLGLFTVKVSRNFKLTEIFSIVWHAPITTIVAYIYIGFSRRWVSTVILLHVAAEQSLDTVASNDSRSAEVVTIPTTTD